MTVETLRSQVVELKITRTTKAAEVAEVNRNAWIAHVQLGRKLLERMQDRFRELAEADERKLKRKAQAEQDKAKLAEDPLERYRAGRPRRAPQSGGVRGQCRASAHGRLQPVAGGAARPGGAGDAEPRTDQASARRGPPQPDRHAF